MRTTRAKFILYCRTCGIPFMDKRDAKAFQSIKKGRYPELCARCCIGDTHRTRVGRDLHASGLH